MSLREYKVTVNGQTFTMLLDDDDARAYGERAVLVETPASPSRTPRRK